MRYATKEECERGFIPVPIPQPPVEGVNVFTSENFTPASYVQVVEADDPVLLYDPNGTLMQFHWQDRNPPYKSELVAQGRFSNADAVHKWARGLIRERGSECPEGWVPMICTEDSEHFVWAAPTGI